MMNDRRRQGLLREGQVADLYGEDTLNEIVFQSRTIPQAVPLTFGCGYVKAGDWLPARHELERYVQQPKPLQRLLSAPFAWHSSLRDLKAAVAEQRRKLAPYLYLADPGFLVGGFSSLSALMNEATVNAKRDANNFFFKNSITTVAGAAYWLWMATGYPAAGTIPAANVAATATSAATQGAFGQPNAPASNTKHFVNQSGGATVAAGGLLLVDMTLLVQPVLATLVAQTITGSPTRYQSNGQNGVLPFAFKGAAADANAAPNLTITYTESTVGTTGHTTGAVTGNATNPAYRTEIGSGQIFFPLAANDVGVRRIETTTWSVARSQATAFGLAYPMCFMPVGAANAIFGVDGINTQFNLAQIIDGACLTWFLLAAASSSGLIQGMLELVSGNS